MPISSHSVMAHTIMQDQKAKQDWQLNGLMSGSLNVCNARAIPMLIRMMYIMFYLFNCFVNNVQRYACFGLYLSVCHAIKVHLCNLFTKYVTFV